MAERKGSRGGGGGGKGGSKVLTSSSKSNKQWNLQELRPYEANRRSQAKSKLDSTKLYWKAFLNLLQGGRQEVFRAHRLILGIIKTHELMAEMFGATTTNANMQIQRKKNIEIDTGVVDSLNESTIAVQTEFRNSTPQLQDVADRVESLVSTADDEAKDLLQRGKSYVQIMENAETIVTEAWEAYFEVVRLNNASEAQASLPSGEVVVSFAGSPNPEPKRTPPGRTNSELSIGSTASSASTHSRIAPVLLRDRWLAEVNYRHCLVQQQEAWNSSLQGLVELFAAAKAAECRRRINLREYMVLFTQACKETFGAVEAAQTAALVDWIEKDVNPDMIAEQVNEAIAQEQAGFETTSDIQGLNDRLSIAGFYKDLFFTSAPLDSEHITLTIVVEKLRRMGDAAAAAAAAATAAVVSQSTPNNDSPANRTGTPNSLTFAQLAQHKNVIALIIVTKDGFFHLFYAPEKSKLTLKDATPEDVLEKIVSMSPIRSPDGGKTYRPELKRYKLEPALSIELAKLTIAMSELDNAVEISAKHASTLTQNFDRLCLRTNSTRDQVSLINALHRQDTRTIL